jgi:hypothetical protein
MSSPYRINSALVPFAIAAVMLLSGPFTPLVRAEDATKHGYTLACKKLVTFGLFDTYMRTGNLSDLIRKVMEAVQIGQCVMLPFEKPLAAVDYAENKTCFKFEGSGNDCMWIRNADTKQGESP